MRRRLVEAWCWIAGHDVLSWRWTNQDEIEIDYHERMRCGREWGA